MAFQKTVNITQAPGVAGDFASTNPRHSVLSPEGGFVAGATGVTVAAFAWATADANGVVRVLSSSGTGAPAGFVHRNMNALITTYLADTSLVIPAGFGVGDLYDAGDFWALNSGTTAVTVGMAAFANETTGAVSFAASGATVTGAVQTTFVAATAGAVGEIVKITSTQPV